MEARPPKNKKGGMKLKPQYKTNSFTVFEIKGSGFLHITLNLSYYEI